MAAFWRRGAPLVVLAVALGLTAPVLTDTEWQASSWPRVMRAYEATPALTQGTFGFDVVAIAAYTLAPAHPRLALNLLSLASLLALVELTRRLRGRLHDASLISERAVAALALVVMGVVWRQSVAADVHLLEAAVAIAAVLVAWSGQFWNGAALGVLATVVSAAAWVHWPLLAAAGRTRRETATIAGAALVSLPVARAVPHPVLTIPPDWVRDWGVLVVSLACLLPLIAVGAWGDAQRSSRGRRFLVATGLALVATAVTRPGEGELGRQWVPVLPYVAVVVGGAIIPLRRWLRGTAAFRRRMALGIVGWLIACNAALSGALVVWPPWQAAREFRARAAELPERFRGAVIVGTPSSAALYQVANMEGEGLPLSAVQLDPDTGRRHNPTGRSAGDERRLGMPEPAASPLIWLTEQASRQSRESPMMRVGALELHGASIVPTRTRPGDTIAVGLDWRYASAARSRVQLALRSESGVRRLGAYRWGVAADSLAGAGWLAEQVMLHIPPATPAGQWSVVVAIEAEPGGFAIADWWRRSTWAGTPYPPPKTAWHRLGTLSLVDLDGGR